MERAAAALLFTCFILIFSWSAAGVVANNTPTRFDDGSSTSHPDYDSSIPPSSPLGDVSNFDKLDIYGDGEYAQLQEPNDEMNIGIATDDIPRGSKHNLQIDWNYNSGSENVTVQAVESDGTFLENVTFLSTDQANQLNITLSDETESYVNSTGSLFLLFQEFDNSSSTQINLDMRVRSVTEPPNLTVTNITVWDVTGLSSSERETGGTLEDSGLNKTFRIEQSKNTRDYRFSFEVTNKGGLDWNLASEDEMYHTNWNDTWLNEKIWYNTSGQDYSGNSSVSDSVNWDPGAGGHVDGGDRLYAKYIAEVPTNATSDILPARFVANDTSENTTASDYHDRLFVKWGQLAIDIHEPPNDSVVQPNEFFLLNASARCWKGECSSVSLSPRYNESVSSADTLVPENSGTPFYTNSSNSKTCDTDLVKDETCFTDWFINATGALESWHLLDANASSTENEVQSNDSVDHLVQINGGIIIDLSWNTTRFGILDPGSENNSALGNDDLEYNLTVDEDSEPVDELWIRSTDLENVTSGYSIPAENMSYSNTNDIGTETFLSNDYQLVKTDLDPGAVVNFFFWLDMPTGKKKGGYNGTYYFKANSTR